MVSNCVKYIKSVPVYPVLKYFGQSCDCMNAAIRNSVVAVVGVFAVASCSPFVAVDLA